MDALEAIKKRRSVRSFLDTKVERKDLLTILEAGLTGPSACNRRPWEFVVVEDRTTLDALSKGNLAAKPLLSAPLAIVVMGNTDKAIRRAPLYWTEDASAATENMIIAAPPFPSAPCGWVCGRRRRRSEGYGKCFPFRRI